MGIQVEFNPDLALRNISEHKNASRSVDECIPEKLETGKEYEFLKRGQRFYWLHEELPLLETKGDGQLSLPLASVVIKEATHFKNDGDVWTKGKYEVKEVFTDDKPHFNGFEKI